MYRCHAIVDLILPVIGLHYRLPQHVIYKKKIDKNNASPTVEWLFRVANLHIIGPGRSVMLPEVFGHVSLYLHRAQTSEKKQ